MNKAIDLNPNYEETYRNRAKVYEALGKKDKAKADIEKAESLIKGNGELKNAGVIRNVKLS